MTLWRYRGVIGTTLFLDRCPFWLRFGFIASDFLSMNCETEVTSAAEVTG